jgi:hypothetical protein
VARARNLSDTVPVSLSLPKETYDYLTFLAWKGRLGATEADVASHILIERVDELLKSGYHDLEVPKPMVPAVIEPGGD